MPLPKTYKQAAFKEAGGQLVIEEIALTPPGKGQVLVKVEACGVCHSDVFAQNNAYGYGFPIVPGHEIIGRVAAVGENVTEWKTGDRVGGAWHGAHDGTCPACKDGLFQMCNNQLINGVTKDGGYAEYCKINSEAAVRVPEHVDAAEYAPVLCAGVTVFASMRRMGIRPGATVAIQGLGGLGHLAVQYANKFGWRVVALSRGPDKEKFARELGAHEYVDANKVDAAEALQKLGGAAMIVTTAPHADAVKPLLGGLGPLGKLLILGVTGEFPISSVSLIGKGLSVLSWPTGHAVDCEETIAFTELQNINCMIEKFPLEKANEAMAVMLDGKVRFRAVLTFE